MSFAVIKNSKQAEQLLRQAHQLYGSRKFEKAEVLYRQVLIFDPDSRDILQTMVAICLQTQRPDQAEEFLERLVNAYPGESRYYHHYANLLLQHGKSDDAVNCYLRLLDRQPELADSHYNFALLLKRAGRYDEALEQYKQALHYGIANPEEVYSNMSVIHSDLHRDEDAQASLQQAMVHNPDYIPARYNLALLKEEQGKQKEAHDLYQSILILDPEHTDALVRLAQLKTVEAQDDELVGQLEHALTKVGNDDLVRENLNFALGKVYDDCGCYEQAFKHYGFGNFCASQRIGAYDQSRQQALTTQLIDTFSPTWLKSIQPVSDANPI